MKNITLIIAPLGARNKKANIFNEIISNCPDNNYSSVLYITPSAFGSSEARRQFFSYVKVAHKKTAYIPFQSISLKQICSSLYESYGKREIIPEDITPLLLCEILGEKTPAHAILLSELLYKLRHYAPNKDLSEIKETVKQLIFEEKVLKRAINALETLELYEKKIEEKGFIDSESVLMESISLIKEFLNPSLLVLDGFFDPTALEQEIINALLINTVKAVVLVEENAEFLKFFESLEASKKWEVRSEKLEKAIVQRKGTGYYTYPSMEDEVEGIARAVKGLILEGTKPQEIIVSFPSVLKYLPMLKRVFKKHEIPLSIAMYDLSNTKPLVALQALLMSIEDDYPRDEFLSFITSPYFSKIPESLREWIVEYSGRAGIIKGKAAWLSIKNILLSSADEEVSEGEKNFINEVQKGIKTAIESLERVKEAKDMGSFLEEIETVLSRFGFMESLEEPLADAINSKFVGLRHFAERFGSGLKGIEAGYYLKYLIKGLRGSDENKYGVRVLPYEFAAGLEAKAMFFGGMIEGDFPSRPDIDPILPENVKKSLGIPYVEYYLDRQKRYFKRLLNVSVFEPYFSYPSGDGDKLFLPSPFLDWGQTLIPPALDMPTEEDILTMEGFFKQKDFAEILWNGDFPEEKEIKKLLAKYFRQNAFIRVTDIDAYRKCPLRFYIEKVLGLEAEKPLRFEVEARLWGSIAHKAMEYLYKDGEIELEDINKRIIEGLEIALKSREVGTIGDFWKGVAREIFSRLIPMIEKQEMDIRMNGFSSYVIEKGIRTEIEGIKLKGKIDRVDIKKIRNPKSEIRNKENSVILLDYKTGSIDKDSLQLPLYAAMWQSVDKDTVEKVGFYSLKDGSIEWFPKGLSMEEFIEEALQISKEIIQKIRDGIFAPEPFKDTECRYCYHRAVCKRNS